MNKAIDGFVVEKLREMYEEDANAKILFEHLAERVKDSAETKAERVSNTLGIEYYAVIALFRQLDEIGCGQFIVGRKQSPSRFRWTYSLRSVGLAAIGGVDGLDVVDNVDLDPWEDADEVALAPAPKPARLTIAEAKRILAESLGVDPEAIEIIVRA